MEAILLIGIPASGKSTFYRERFSATHLRINLDMLRTRHREQCFVMTCLQTRQRFVVDNTNLTEGDRARYIVPAKAAGFRVIGYYFSSSAKECAQRNVQREGRACISPAAIYAAARRLQPPHMAEGFDELYSVTMEKDGFRTLACVSC